VTPNTNRRSSYPPVEVAVALAERSHALPGSSPAARARLAFVAGLDAAEEAGWSEETRAAHVLREVDWLVLARHLGESLDRLQRLDPTVLLARLGRHRDRTI
jgi:hypothetical protein